MEYYMGIDIGSVSANAVLVDSTRRVAAYLSIPSGYNHAQTVRELRQRLCESAGIHEAEVCATVGTGYGRKNIEGARSITEITCHAAGVRHMYPEAGCIIDIVGQDSKVIRMSSDGTVKSFAMNDRCAAGTGRFLEVMAGVMKLDLDSFSACAKRAASPYPISSTCTVFAETEVISGIAKGAERESIAAGICRSIAERVLMLAGNIPKDCALVLTGGVAKNDAVAFFFRKKYPTLKIPFDPQITGALGAAMMAVRYG